MVYFLWKKNTEKAFCNITRNANKYYILPIPDFGATLYTIQNIRTTFSIVMLHGLATIDHPYFNAEEHWQWPNLKKLSTQEDAWIQPADAFPVT